MRRMARSGSVSSGKTAKTGKKRHINAASRKAMSEAAKNILAGLQVGSAAEANAPNNQITMWPPKPV
jgi:hypothetical protein